jgi:hypothetical protein
VNVAILSCREPFRRGRTELLAGSLAERLRAAGHRAQVVELPFSTRSVARIFESMLAARLVALRNVDRVVALAFPAYYVSHDDTVIWLQDDFRPSSAVGAGEPHAVAALTDAVDRNDARLLARATGLFVGSAELRDRIRRRTGVEAAVLPSPLGSDGGTWEQTLERLTA